MFSDSEIIERIRQGDKQEFEKLFRSCYASLVRYAKTLIRDHDASEEIVQELFFRLWQDRQAIRIESSLNGYLYKSVYNRALHYLEHQKVISRHAGEVLAAADSASEPVTDAIYYHELQARVARVLERLPERSRLIFRMNRFEGLKYNEIADKLAVSLKTVEADMGKALREFRKALAE
ncbi:MAG TPA: RNA polymerase sigma-70 factor [Bacteroidales bacterium]|jgi:RNA polymerase sigma-70 factor (ECF subfamily)|nr:RNA polymerase sigma-70 factor [Bacteroidales bacterium]MDI9532674.1 RNA polymerase sigma-70 factor [Bacteroidota bacterium]MBP7036047.1 RNA polymerase sigma-70 factor [Bacteroidales bacterium]MBP8709111.1 RNA polymerase sigma-70 factor [Bacteroidales bacterium]MZQ79584.1 RNA polymerase sigma-70 factor [Bacteroidales bacterium]